MSARVGLLKGVIVLVLFGLLFVTSTALAQPVGNHYTYRSAPSSVLGLNVVLLHPKSHSYGLPKAELFNTSLPIAPIVREHKKPFVIVIGTIEVYDGVVYLNISILLHVLKIGNQTFVEKNETFVPLFTSHEHVLRNPSYLGVIEDKNIASYVLNHTGSFITIFPPSGNSTFKYVVKDVGTLNSQPHSAHEIFYVPILLHIFIIEPLFSNEAFEICDKHLGC